MAEAVAVSRALKAVVESGARPDYEVVLTRAYSRIIGGGDVIVDIGAHSGRHLRHFLDLVQREGCLYAFEPLPQMFALLLGEFGSLANVRLFNLALSDFNGKAEFTVASTPEESGFREKHYNTPGVTTSKIEVDVARLDDALGKDVYPSFIKVDVEGAELSVLRGARETLARARPVISVEFGYPAYSAYSQSQESLYKFAMEMGYGVSDLFGNVIESLEDWNLICDYVYWDYLLFPKERRASFTRVFAAGT